MRKSRSAILLRLIECDAPLCGSSRHVLGDAQTVAIGRGEERTWTREPAAARLSLKVPDRWMSVSHARLERQLDQWLIEDADSKNGISVNGVPQKRAALRDGDLLRLGHTLFLFRVDEPGPTLDLALDGGTTAEGEGGAGDVLATLNPALAQAFASIRRVAGSMTSILLTGETGTGKERIARAVHELSGRKGPLVAINCSALPPTLIESELFGYRKGAFSGAIADRVGLILGADGGTLLLDEVGDLPLPTQAALLRVLQEREVLPVGGRQAAPVDFRLIAATHRRLDRLVAEQTFRADLLARLMGFAFVVPALRARREDLGMLVGALLRRIAPAHGTELRITVEAAQALFRYEWPLNVRELEKCLEAAVALAGGDPIALAHLPEAVRQAGEQAARRIPADLSDADSAQRAELIALLQKHGGNVSAVARAMGKARMQVQRWIKRYGLDPEDYR